MADELQIAITIGEPQLARQVLDAAKNLDGIRVVEGTLYGGKADAGTSRTAADIVLIDDRPEGEDLFRRLELLRGEFPQSSIFVVSADTRPQRIVEVMKAGAAEYLLLPLDRNLLQTAVDEVRARRLNTARSAGGQVFSFISSKGGLGTSVIAVNAATALLRKKGGNVALLDLSLQAGDASVLLDLVPTTTILDISRNFHRLDLAFLRSAMNRHKSGLDFLPAPLDQADSQEVSGDQVGRIVELARKLYDAVLVDCTSMSTNGCTLEAFRASERIFVVTDLSIPAVRNATRLLRLLEKSGLPPERIEVVVNRFIKGGALSLEEAERTLGRRIFWLFPNDFADVVSSINEGVPLVQAKPGAPFARNLSDFVEKLVNPRADADYRGLRGTFGRAI